MSSENECAFSKECSGFGANPTFLLFELRTCFETTSLPRTHTLKLKLESKAQTVSGHCPLDGDSNERNRWKIVSAHPKVDKSGNDCGEGLGV